MGIQLLSNGIPHDAIVLTNNICLDEFKPSKVLSIPSQSASLYPWEVEIHLTGVCCLSCIGCSYKTRHSNHSLTVEDIERIFYSIKKMKTHTLFFSGGGDPLCWSDWSYLRKLKNDIIPTVITGISTNLIPEIDCEFLNGFFNIIQIHVIGFDKRSCIENTNVDCFNQFDKQLALLSNPNIILKILINFSNYKLLNHYLSYLERFDAKTIVLKFEQDFLKNAQLFNENVFTQLIDVVANHHILSKYKNAFYTQTDNNSLAMPSACHVVDKHLYCLIRENGEVYPCIASTYSSKNSIGNIHSVSLEKIYKSRIDSSYFSNIMKLKECPLGACRHFRFNQELETSESTVEVVTNIVPDLL